MNNEELLRNIIREIIEEEFKNLTEMTTTGDVAGYNIPAAFTGNKPRNVARKAAIAQQLGWKLTKRGRKELGRGADKLHEGADPYYAWRAEQISPAKKIARAISEVNANIQEIGKVLKRNKRLKTESGITNETLYRRTQEGLLKLETRLLNLAGQVREMRGT